MHPQSLAEEEVKTEPEVVEGMDISTRSKAQLGETNRFKVLSGLKEWMHGEDKKDTGSAERAAPKRKAPSPQHSSNGHSPQETPPSPVKKKKKHSLVNNNNKDQTELRHGPFYYMKQPQTSDPVDVMPQDGRNDFYCWVCHREGQVLCCELCPRVYHAKCLKLNEEPEGDWFCPECEKITVAECIETQSKAMTLLTIEQLSYLLKFALQKMKQPGTEPFQKPVSLDQHPDYAEYIFHPMDLSTLEKNVKKKMYGCTEAFLADVKWILHNCIIYNGDTLPVDSTPCDIPSSGNKQTGKVLRSSSRRCQRRQVTAASTSPKGALEVHKGNPWRSQNFATPQMPHWSRFSRNHKLTQTAKVLIKICEHEMNEIEVCPECYLSACQKRESWFCEPCSHPHPLVWAKLKGFPFWPAKALRDKEGQVDARFFGQHDRAWVPMNNCYLMSKEIPFSVKKTKSIFNSAMQEMEIYVENIRRKFGVFNYAPFRTPYTPNNQYQMLVDTGNPSAGTVKTEKPEKIKLNFDMTGSPKILLGKHSISGAGSGRRISLSDMPRSPMSTNSSVHTGSDAEPDTDKKTASTHFSASEESMDFIDKSTASPASTKTGQAGSQPESPKPFSPQASTTVSIKQEKTPTTGSILNLNLDRSKAEMELKELSESVLQQSTPTRLISPKRQIRSRFQLNLDKTIESCKAQLGINEISDDVYKATEHSDSEETEKSDSSDSESISDDEQKPKTEQDDGEEKESNKTDKESSVKKKPKPPVPQEVKEEAKSTDPPVEKIESTVKETKVMETEKDTLEKVKSVPPTVKEKVKGKDETDSPTVHLGLDSDSENELVIDLEADQSGRQGLKGKKEIKEPTPNQDDAAETVPAATSITEPQPETPILTRSSTQIPAATVTATPNATCTIAIPIAVTGSPVRKQRPLLPKETVPGTPTPSRVVWNSSNKFQTSSQKWHMQKVQRQQQQQQTQPQSPTTPPPATAAAAPTPPPTAATPPTAVATPPTVVASPTPTAALTATTAVATAVPTTLTPLTPTQSSPGTRYQTRQAVKAVQQKEITQSSTSTSTITLVTSTQPISMVTSSGSGITHTTSINTDLPIATASADVAADIAKYTGKMMDAIKGTMTEIYNDLSKTTAGSTIAEIRRLRIEIEKLQWLHQQELSEMKHNLELTMAEMRQSLEQERDRLIAEVKKQMEMEKQQSVDETKKKQWCANCKKEAIFYCCWNTSYCDYPCQQAHWPEHMKSCTQSATATQQETDTEPGTDAANKPIQPNPAQLSPTETANGSKEKDNSADKSKECVTIATTVPSTQPIKLVQVPQTTTFMPATQPTITIPVVVSPTGGAVAMRPGVQYVQTTMPVQVRRV